MYRLLLICSVLLTSCIPNRAYRAPDLAVIPQRASCSSIAPNSVLLEQGSWTLPQGSRDLSKKGYKLGFIEFDDFGEFHNRCELINVINAIHEAKQGPAHSVAVVLFVHGWKNNASDQSGNVWGFREELKDVLRNGGVPPGVPVLGIYLGWRGDVTKFGKNLTFWDRRDTATHVGGADMTETLLSVINETKGLHYQDPSVCILVGHSFGGLLLEHALTQTLINVLEREAAEQTDCRTTTFNAPVDLVALINEAAPAIEAKKTLAYLAVHNVHLRRGNQERPLIVAMTSQTDLATKIALPGGQALSLPFNSLRTYDQSDQFGIKNQKSYFLQSTANMTSLQSHVVGNEEDPAIAAAFLEHPSSQFAAVNIDQRTYRILRITKAKNDTAYWVMQIPSEIVPDHGTIFRPEFRKFLQAFLPPMPEVGQTRATAPCETLAEGPSQGPAGLGRKSTLSFEK